MASTTLRSLSGSAMRADVEALIDLQSRLVRERQSLRASSADEAALEQNRLAIVTCQWELSQALIQRYLPGPAVISAA
jgi:hypothetical protein